MITYKQIIQNTKQIFQMLHNKSRDFSLETKLNRSERRSLELHRQISLRLNETSLQEWTPQIKENLLRLKESVQGEPHLGNIERWEKLVLSGDTKELRRTLTGLDRHSIEMREVSPMSGILSQEERLEVLCLRQQASEKRR